MNRIDRILTAAGAHCTSRHGCTTCGGTTSIESALQATLAEWGPARFVRALSQVQPATVERLPSQSHRNTCLEILLEHLNTPESAGGLVRNLLRQGHRYPRTLLSLLEASDKGAVGMSALGDGSPRTVLRQVGARTPNSMLETAEAIFNVLLDEPEPDQDLRRLHDILTLLMVLLSRRSDRPDSNPPSPFDAPVEYALWTADEVFEATYRRSCSCMASRLTNDSRATPEIELLLTLLVEHGRLTPDENRRTDNRLVEVRDLRRRQQEEEKQRRRAHAEAAARDAEARQRRLREEAAAAEAAARERELRRLALREVRRTTFPSLLQRWSALQPEDRLAAAASEPGYAPAACPEEWAEVSDETLQQLSREDMRRLHDRTTNVRSGPWRRLNRRLRGLLT